MHTRIHTILLAAILLLSTAFAHAEPALDHLPEDALGFVLIRNLEATNAKIESVTKIFQEVSPMPIPAPLPVLKAATGLGEGLNEQGDALLAFLPGDDQAAVPRPLLVVTVSDYAKFAASVNGDATGEVCRVTIAGEEILVAKRGTHAVLMNVEHRERLEALLTAAPKPLPALAPLADWLSKIDVAAVLTPHGVELLTTMGRQQLANQGPDMDESLRETLEMYETVLDFLGAELTIAAAGIAIDDQSNVKLVSQAILKNEGALKGFAASPAAEFLPLAGYPDEPYVMAAGGPIPPAYGKATASFMRRLIEANPEWHGFQKLTDDDWQELEDSWKDAMQGIRSLSMAVLTGGKDDPLYSNVYSVMKVDDAAKYLDVYAKSMEKWNELLAETTTDIDLNYEIKKVEVAGKKALLMTANFGEVADDPNVPMIKPMMQALFGEDTTMRMYLVASDDTTVVLGISKEEDVAAAIKRIADGETGLADASATQITLKLLDAKAPWIGVLSPQGAVAWITRFYDKFLAHLGQGMPKIPEYPDSSPIGFAVNFSEGRLSTEMVWPVDALQGLAAYIKTVQDSF
jgi:hypothetical protein